MGILIQVLVSSAFFVSILVSGRLHANNSDFLQKELIGTLSVSDILIQPRIISTEGKTNNFELDRSYFFFSWKMNSQLSAHFGLGQNSLINHNTRIGRDANEIAGYDDFGFFEAYGQFESAYGTLKAGIIPLRFGWEGNRRESEWIFPRTLFFGGEDDSSGNYAGQNFGLRDYGLSYSVTHNYFYTQAAS